MKSFSKVKIRELDLNLTNRCNLKCRHCAFSSHIQDKDELDYKKVCELIDEIIDLGLEDVHLTGGEPTLYHKLPEVIEYIVSKGVTTRLITNGLILDEKKLRMYKDKGLKGIMYSIDGMEETHNWIRGGNNSFKRAVESIQKAKMIGYNIRVNAVISKTNINEIIELIHFVKTLRADIFSFFLYSPTGREAKEQLDKVVEPHEWRRLIYDLRKFIESEKIEEPKIVSEKGFLWEDEDMDFSTYKGRGGGCYYLADICDYLILLANGDVYPCALLTDKGIRYGNIYERSLHNIIENPENKEIYRNFQRQDDLCRGCKSWNTCHAACKAFTYVYFKHWRKTDPRCNKIKEENLDYIPLCPLHKENLITGIEGGYSEKVVDEI